ncbi:peptidase C39 family protein [Streptomyces griseus]|uniref:peptidase C39 family protein n=1 Tax=Streptomyces griseus TaxID=1911 RepID=UPI0033DAC541
MTPTPNHGRHTVVPYEPGAWPDALRQTARPDVLERWDTVDRSPHTPRLLVTPDGDGAALLTARPGTAYVKIVDAVGNAGKAVEAVLSYAGEQGLAQVKWEGWTASAENTAAAGFAPLRLPLTRGPGEPGAGYVRWLDEDGGIAEPPYYRQSTDFTCGAVTALIAQTHAGAGTADPIGRQAELTLWREATNFPACEPVGLGVAVRRRWQASRVKVHLDTHEPVLLSHLSESEQEWRAVLQHASRSDAERLGVPVDARRLSLPALRRGIGQERQHVLLLVSLSTMQGFHVPHWVLCHGVVPGAVVVEDPWFNTAAGETWVDAHLLPVPDAALDTMSLITPERFRGAVVIGRPRLDPPGIDVASGQKEARAVRHG